MIGIGTPSSQSKTPRPMIHSNSAAPTVLKERTDAAFVPPEQRKQRPNAQKDIIEIAGRRSHKDPAPPSSFDSSPDRCRQALQRSSQRIVGRGGEADAHFYPLRKSQRQQFRRCLAYDSDRKSSFPA